MSKITTNWEFNLKMETLRVLETSYLTVTNSYKEKGFYVVPLELDSSIRRDYSEILLPHLPYQNIPRYWQKVARINYAPFPIKPPNELVEQTQNLLENTFLAEPFGCEEKEVLWDRMTHEVSKFLHNMLPVEKEIREIIIYHTRIGSKVTFNRSKENPYVVKMYLRKDAGIYYMLYGLITSITRHEVLNKLFGTWEGSQLLSDWILEYSALNDILVRHRIKTEPLLRSLKSKQKAHLELKSAEYLAQLGLTYADTTYKIDSDAIYINSKKMKNLSPSNIFLLKLLIQHRGSVLDFENIGKSVFPNGEDFSLYALSKQVQRLRNKLEQNGLPSNLIITKRGKGLMLR